MTALVDRIDAFDLVMCSTPFGIKDDGTMNAHTLSAGEKGCSTPFGIKDDGTMIEADSTLPKCRCSTPFGIKDDGTFSKYG
ncbi:hypothetical protein ACCUM_4315 [Candidatus Accumulibacter phosphatis]|uniref:Uncharacterized protein n=1 Tax=Candidatus Accumulibacter phosphatis TaxID=327160 RepID=A0A5S4EMF7_9PROT|nr:hypothetical protein ACCUM_4315 [Candidatus Accumulibacter phosphatis]